MMMKPDAAASIWLSQLPMLIACVALAGCADQPIGQGPIKFTPKMQAQYDQYRQSTTPGAFVVTKQGSTFYSYCDSLDCRTGATSMAMRLCRQRDVGECFVYDIGGRVVWREDLPPSMSAEPVEAAMATERGRNALKVDCSDQVKATMPPTFRAEARHRLGREGLSRTMDILRSARGGRGKPPDHDAGIPRRATGPGRRAHAFPIDRPDARWRQRAVTTADLAEQGC